MRSSKNFRYVDLLEAANQFNENGITSYTIGAQDMLVYEMRKSLYLS